MIEYKAPFVSIDTKMHPRIFLAGGITGCPDWQAIAVQQFKDLPGEIYNPRRDNFPIDDPTAAKTQIVWEYEHLHKADHILMWFCQDTIQPIVLYECGYHLARGRLCRFNLFIGIEPGYSRESDVRIQAELSGYSLPIPHTLEALCILVQEAFRTDTYGR